MKKISLTISAAALSVAALALDPYKVIAPVDAEPGTTIYLTNFDTGAKLDSAIVSSDKAVTFSGELDEPFPARLIGQDGRRHGTFIVELGTLAINPKQRRGVGSMLNDQLNMISDSLNTLESQFESLTGAALEQKQQEWIGYLNSQIAEHADDPIGYVLSLELSYIDPDAFEQAVGKYGLDRYQRVQGLLKSIQTKRATAEGMPMVDFSVEWEGHTENLSDYVGQGEYVLVDFWASWCGPCIREIKTLKEIYDEYSDKGLQVLGVAVWDKPEDTVAAIQRLDIPWPCIINSQNIATDAYGIPAIPCIILFGPDGTILARDHVGADLKSIVAAQLSK
ncbi:MAG: AhpC/TSA family protein [Bacteroidales bacterium]|nr:AhpC/TSA family protein [Bacteroidales bacterium]